MALCVTLGPNSDFNIKRLKNFKGLIKQTFVQNNF